MKRDVWLYFKVFGLAEDKNGNPDYAGLKMTIGSTERDVKYSELIAKTTDAVKENIAKILPFKGVKASDIQIITPEEYARDYGDEDNG